MPTKTDTTAAVVPGPRFEQDPLAQPPAIAPAHLPAQPGALEKPHAGAAWARMLGLHPLVAFGMVAVDFMLFGGETATGGIGLALTIPIALALSLPCILLQRYSFGDNWGAALGKGMMVGVLTAIPFPIGSPLTIIGAILGFRAKKR